MIITFSNSIARPSGVITYSADSVVNIVGDPPATAGFLFNAGSVKGGYVVGVNFSSSVNPTTKLVGELWLFAQTPGSATYTGPVPLADNATTTVGMFSDTDIANCIAVVPLNDTWYTSLPSNPLSKSISFNSMPNGPQPFEMATLAPTIYGVLITRASYTAASAEVFTADLLIQSE